jgi:hypothetical protein
MARDTILRKNRDNQIRSRFTYHRKKNPKWTIIAVIVTVSDEVYLKPTTVAKILKRQHEDVPSVDTVIKYTQVNMLQ